MLSGVRFWLFVWGKEKAFGGAKSGVICFVADGPFLTSNIEPEGSRIFRAGSKRETNFGGIALVSADFSTSNIQHRTSNIEPNEGMPKSSSWGLLFLGGFDAGQKDPNRFFGFAQNLIETFWLAD